jgi:hypothetical protein
MRIAKALRIELPPADEDDRMRSEPTTRVFLVLLTVAENFPNLRLLKLQRHSRGGNGC